MRENQVFVIPTKDCLKTFLGWSLVAWIAFPVVYGLTNYYASGQNELYQMYASWELDVPLIPEMIVIYFTLNILFGIVLFVLKDNF